MSFAISNDDKKGAYTLVCNLYAKDDPECIKKLIAKLQEASQTYSMDKETLGWYVDLFECLWKNNGAHDVVIGL